MVQYRRMLKRQPDARNWKWYFTSFNHENLLDFQVVLYKSLPLPTTTVVRLVIEIIIWLLVIAAAVLLTIPKDTSTVMLVVPLR
jgi:hypothetical protein